MPDETVSRVLILASSSPYRAALLERLRLPFESVAPQIDETPGESEPPRELVTRLAIEKALAVARDHNEAFVLGSDQVAVHGGEIAGKPETVENACRQLEEYSGTSVDFLSAVALVREREVEGIAVVQTRVTFRNLTTEEIQRYVDKDQPLDCAGSFRAERLGPALFESSFSQDPTAIIGLPLIETSRLLRGAGFELP